MTINISFHPQFKTANRCGQDFNRSISSQRHLICNINFTDEPYVTGGITLDLSKTGFGSNDPLRKIFSCVTHNISDIPYLTVFVAGEFNKNITTNNTTCKLKLKDDIKTEVKEDTLINETLTCEIIGTTA